MDHARFILVGSDKKLFARIKSTLVANGHIFMGFSGSPDNVLRHARSLQPELIIFEVQGFFKDIKNAIEIIDEELLAACVLIVESRNDEIDDFIRCTRSSTYITKPVYDEALIQIVDLSLANYKRVISYEEKVKGLNEELESRKLVDKAKWLLVNKDNMKEADAYEYLRKKSRNTRKPMREIAEAILLARDDEFT